MNVFSSITRGSTSATTHQRNPLRRRRYPTHPSATRKYACVYSSDVMNRAGFSAAFVSRLRHGVVRCFDSTGFLL